MAAWGGQSIKVRLGWFLGVVGVDAARPRVLVAGHEVAGGIGRAVEGDGNAYARLGGNGVLTGGTVAVAVDAQYATVRVRGLTTGSDQLYLDVRSGPGFATVTNVFAGSVADGWTTLRATVVGWRGQEVKLRVRRAYGTVGVDDLGAQTVDLPGWEVTNVVARETGAGWDLRPHPQRPDDGGLHARPGGPASDGHRQAGQQQRLDLLRRSADRPGLRDGGAAGLRAGRPSRVGDDGLRGDALRRADGQAADPAQPRDDPGR